MGGVALADAFSPVIDIYDPKLTDSHAGICSSLAQIGLGIFEESLNLWQQSRNGCDLSMDSHSLSIRFGDFVYGYTQINVITYELDISSGERSLNIRLSQSNPLVINIPWFLVNYMRLKEFCYLRGFDHTVEFPAFIFLRRISLDIASMSLVLDVYPIADLFENGILVEGGRVSRENLRLLENLKVITFTFKLDELLIG